MSADDPRTVTWTVTGKMAALAKGFGLTGPAFMTGSNLAHIPT